MLTTTKHLFLAVSAITLTACSGGHSEGDIQAMMEKELEQTNSAVTSMVGADMANAMRTEIHDVTLHGCDEVRDDVYSCDVEVDLTAPIVGRNVQRSSITLAETDAGWTVTR